MTPLSLKLLGMVWFPNVRQFRWVNHIVIYLWSVCSSIFYAYVYVTVYKNTCPKCDGYLYYILYEQVGEVVFDIPIIEVDFTLLSQTWFCEKIKRDQNNISGGKYSQLIIYIETAR